MKNDISHLTPLQREVTQNGATEQPYENIYNEHFEPGIYVDIVSGEVLFASLHKFPSPCGWPAFYKSIEPANIIKIPDDSRGLSRVEVRSRLADSHLGHVFDDGPAPTGIRYCINSAALRFIAVDELKNQGLGDYCELFEEDKSEAVTKKECITLGAGCFWGVEAILQKQLGVFKTTSGYSGGEKADPSYEDVCSGSSGHAEVVQIEFDSNKISLEEILLLFFKLHDPTTLNYQGADIGTQYRSVIFYHADEQKLTAEKIIEQVNQSDLFEHKIVTEVSALTTFFAAEEYHQDYYSKKYSGGMGPICHYVRGE